MEIAPVPVVSSDVQVPEGWQGRNSEARQGASLHSDPESLAPESTVPCASPDEVSLASGAPSSTKLLSLAASKPRSLPPASTGVS